MKEFKFNSKTQELIHTFVSEVLQPHREELKSTGEYGKQFGIVKDRVCFYIDNHFHLNFEYLRNGVDANKPFVDALAGVMEKLSYEDVRTYYYDNIVEFKDTIDGSKRSNNSVRDATYLIKMKQGSYFLSITNGHISAVNMDAASVVDQFMDRNTTQKVVSTLLEEKGYEEGFILVACKHPDFHTLATF